MTFPRLTFALVLFCSVLLADLVSAGAPQQEGRLLRRTADTPPASAGDTQNAKDSDASATEEPEYVRIRRNEQRLAEALQTSVVTFENSKTFPNATVDLIGAIHLGEPGYYEELNSLFRNYDVLLFEAVMPEEAVERGLRPGNVSSEAVSEAASEEDADAAAWSDAQIGLAAISVLQLGMKDALGLEFQLTGVNYAASNFVHADMTAEEFAASMKRRGESFAQMFAQEMGKSLANSQEQNPLAMNLDFMLSALAPDRMYRVRRIAAVQLAKAGEGEAFAGPDGTSTIITERNIKALEVLQRELKAGHQRVGIFYGAGHLADMEERMTQELGFERTNEIWLTAWQLRESQTAAGEPQNK